MNTFQWLLVLGFPPAVAAEVVRPDVFRASAETPVTPDLRCVVDAWLDTGEPRENAPFAA